MISADDLRLEHCLRLLLALAPLHCTVHASGTPTLLVSDLDLDVGIGLRYIIQHIIHRVARNVGLCGSKFVTVRVQCVKSEGFGFECGRDV